MVSLDNQLVQAVKFENIPRVMELLAVGGSVNARNDNEETLLHIAAMLGNAKLVTLLLDKGADIRAIDKSGLTATLLAFLRKQHQAASILLIAEFEQLDGEFERFIDYAFKD